MVISAGCPPPINIAALYPNVCWYKDKRRVLTLENKMALINKFSVNCAMAGDGEPTFASPFFVFGEKVRTRAITCKQMSMCTPLQLLLFGCRRVQANAEHTVVLDDWFVCRPIHDSLLPPHRITLRMSAALGGKLCALRPCIEALLVHACMQPESIADPPPAHQQLMHLVRTLSRQNVWRHELEPLAIGGGAV
jgi:ATP-dependent RNA helicase A